MDGGPSFPHLEQTKKVLMANHVGRYLARAETSAAVRAKLETIAWWLIKDVNWEVRAALAFELRRAPDISKPLALRIIHDLDEAVSAPFISATPLFSDAEWVGLVAELDDHALTALAHRSVIGADLAEAILANGGPRPVGSVVANPGADLPPRLCGQVVARFKDDRHVLDRLAYRRDLPLPVVQKLIDHVSDAARQQLMATYNLASETAQRVTGRAADTTLLTHLRAKDPVTWADGVRALALAGRLTDGFILCAAERGEDRICLLALAQRAKQTPGELAKRLARADRGAIDDLLIRAEIGKSHRVALARSIAGLEWDTAR